jgi:F-type H+-transporting ATPase subunit b
MMLLAEHVADYVWYHDLSIWSGVVFVILVSVLGRFAGRPIAIAMREREEAVLSSLRQAEITRAETDRLRRLHEQERQKARKQAEALVAEAHRDAERTRNDILAHVQEDVKRLQRRVQREIVLAKRKALDELWQTATELSLETAGRILAVGLSADDHRRLIDQAMADLAQAAGVRT